jgi:hypothetical protein
VGPLGTAMRVRVLHAKLYAYALPGSTARQLFNSSTLLDSSTETDLDRPRQTSTDLDRPRQTSTDLDRPRQTSTPRTPAHAVSLDLPRRDRQLLDSYSCTRQLLDRLDRQGLDSTSTAASTAARRSLDSSTARQPGLKIMIFVLTDDGQILTLFQVVDLSTSSR